MPFVAHVPGVGATLGNDGVVFAVFTRNPDASISPNPNDLYAGGAFLPNPDGDPETGSLRLSQWFATEPQPEGARRLDRGEHPHERLIRKLNRQRELHGEGGALVSDNQSEWLVGMVMLNVTSRGFSHIRSADPLYPPAVTTNALQDPEDVERWKVIFRVSGQSLPLYLNF
jgi:hypothetical protein